MTNNERTLQDLLHPDVLAEYSEPVEVRYLEVGDEVVWKLDSSHDCRFNTVPSSTFFVGFRGEIRRKPIPSPQWPEMAPLTSLGQMAEGTIDGEPARVIVVYTYEGELEPSYNVIGSSSSGCWSKYVSVGDSWSEVLDEFDPGSLHPITPEPVVLTDEQVRMLPKDNTWLINGGDEWRMPRSRLSTTQRRSDD